MRILSKQTRNTKTGLQVNEHNSMDCVIEVYNTNICYVVIVTRRVIQKTICKEKQHKLGSNELAVYRTIQI